MSSDTDIQAKVHYFESQATSLDSMPGEQRARLRREMVKFYDSLDPTKKMWKYAAMGAGAAAILPGIGWITGAIGGAIVASLKNSEAEVEARNRMKNLIDQAG
jgi:hypothetical protein